MAQRVLGGYACGARKPLFLVAVLVVSSWASWRLAWTLAQFSIGRVDVVGLFEIHPFTCFFSFPYVAKRCVHECNLVNRVATILHNLWNFGCWCDGLWRVGPPLDFNPDLWILTPTSRINMNKQQRKKWLKNTVCCRRCQYYVWILICIRKIYAYICWHIFCEFNF